MIEVNRLFGREVVIRDTGEKASKVHDVVFDERTSRVVALLISDGLLESTRVVRWEEVVSIKDVVVVVGGVDFRRLKDDPEIHDLHRKKYRITGTGVIHSGEKIGSIGDIFVDGSGLVVGYEVKDGFFSSNRFLPSGEIESSGKDAFVARTAELPKLKDVRPA
ncbi:PRC-barrel domain-containing protein [Rubrobacter indicoceani]|uniref:PRC-barrel domain-containing protein n=1 Tax=Rubrobacter indicoceani TaxID=2051957 RepID=UPI0013C437CE|nr:PRC-barrel domain-containing protein [Rubrobacter indicoceani]